tara:strand:+ start:30091 stop:30321 length:231 start_codon:yes stop_codon:yes gene_type:complete
MKEYLKVEGYPGLVRDPESNAILNVDFAKIAAAQKRQAESRRVLRERETSNQRMVLIEEDLSEIKSILKALLEKNL